MNTWTSGELDRVASADEVSITTARPDGSLRGAVPIWVVRVGDELYVRSWRGRTGAWFRHAVEAGAAHLLVAGEGRQLTVEVGATEPVDGLDDPVQTLIDEAYRSKYAKYGQSYVGPMTAAEARAATLRLEAPADLHR